MTSYTLYDTATGLPKAEGEMPVTTFNNYARTGEYITSGNVANAKYFDGSELQDRMPHSASLSSSTAQTGGSVTLSGLPVPCSILVDGVTQPVSDGELVLTFEHPGLYYMTMNEKEYIPDEWAVTVNDPN